MTKIVEFQIKYHYRKRLSSKESWFKLQGDLIIKDQRTAQQLAELLRSENQEVHASELNAFGLLHEIEHYMIGYYQKHFFKTFAQQLEDFFEKKLGSTAYQQLLHKYCQYFPPTPIFQKKQTIDQFLESKAQKIPNRYLILEEILLLWVDNQNPAFSPIKALIDPTELKHETSFQKTFKLLNDFFNQAPPLAEENISLLEFLLQPAKKFPHSIQSQLEFIIQHWSHYIGPFLKRLLLSLDFIKEEQKARFDVATFGPGPTVVPQYDSDWEPERFSPDEHWMPRLVLIAKSTYVWLDQLSKKYEQPITKLDQIPDIELERLARFGITGLWLIGIWERSRASQRIKQRTGNPEAMASAYSLYDYVVAQDLGGESALQNLKDRAWRYGIRLATDMVPNHTGIDSKWMIEHPDWFIQLPYSPFPQYSFNGPDLCDHHDVGIFIEDGYWDRSDAAVVFKRVHYPSGDVRYIYHGNDGTSMPWNDTAQLNYLNPEVREAVIQKIIEIARQFPIIRFDAAMTLTKKHFQRLWFPEPGSGGDIPSRAQFAMSKEEFDQHMPQEFWREVVDRIQKEAPDTLLLAEAFWLMEGYFVRTLGMHRVYNSAFMNMLKNEENDKFRLLIKNTLEFNPQILKRYVNFMNNPDEETAVVQFGKGDKYFGVCIMLATLPGLPMFGHGQIEGLAEKYGMEYRRAYWEEHEDSWLIQEHFRLIAPLLKRRYLFSDVENFLLYDLYQAEGTVNENVFAYSNCFQNESALVIYNNSLQPAAGWINQSAAFKKDGQLAQKDLWQGLNLNYSDDTLIVFRDHVAGLYYLRELNELKQKGLFIDLKGYQFQVYLDFQPLQDSPETPFRALCQHLAGRGVPDLQSALKEFLFQPLHLPIKEALANPPLFKVLTSLPKEDDSQIFSDDLQKEYLKLSQQITSFEKKKPVSQRRLKTIVKIAQRYYSIARSEFFKIHSIGLPPEKEERLAAFFNLELFKTNEDAIVFQAFLTFRLLEEIYHQSQDSQTFQDRLLDQLFNHFLDQINHMKFGKHQGLLLLEILNLMPNGLPFNTKKSLHEQLAYLFTLKPVAHFIKIHPYEKILYFNKEYFEELLYWLFILHVLQICKKVEKDGDKLKRSAKKLQMLFLQALKSGYQVENFLKWNQKPLIN